MSEKRWVARPRGGYLLQLAARVLPLAASVAAGLTLGLSWERPEDGAAIGWWVVVLGTSTAVLYLVDRAFRRLLPLASLLTVAMAFPDELPSRFRMALRAGSPRQLERSLARLGETSPSVQESAEILLALVAALSAHDRRTRGHSERVRGFAELLGEEMGLSQEDRDRLRWSSLLHDIGKLSVPAGVLNKEGPLDDDEWHVVKRHPEEGARLVDPLRPWLGEWLLSVEQHHERWDGSGYPKGLKGEEIALAARIVAVADAFEVMTARRSYRAPLDVAVAREELVRSGSTHFDPSVVRALLSLSIGRLKRALGPLSWLIQFPFLAGPLPLPGPGGDVALDLIPEMSLAPEAALHPAAHHHAVAQLHPEAQDLGAGRDGSDQQDLLDHLPPDEET